MSEKFSEITTRRTVWSVAFMGDGRHIVSGGDEGVIRKWNVENGVEIGQTMKASGTIYALTVSKNGRWIVSGDTASKVIVWDAITHQKVLDISGHSGYVGAVDISTDSTRIASGGSDKTARIFNLTSGVQLVGPLLHDNVVFGVKFSPDGNQIVTATSDWASVRVYDAHTGGKLLDIPLLMKHYASRPLAWSLDGQQLFAASQGKITCLRMSTSLRQEWSTQDNEPRACLLTTTRFIICSSGFSVSFWDIISREQIGRLIKHPAIVSSISVSSDAKYLACGHGSTITVHRLSDILPPAYFTDFIPLVHLSDAARKSWLQEEPAKTEIILSEEISQLEEPNHDALANRALIRTRSNQWDLALDDANESIKIKPSPVGHIAKALTLVGKGEEELALEAFDYAFHDCDQKENKFLLLIKAILLFVCGKHHSGISRVHGLISAADPRPGYFYQVLGNMYLKQCDYERAVRTFEDAKSLPFSSEQGHLTAISLIFGWTFDGIEVTAWKRLCESLYATGRVKEVGVTLSRMVNCMGEDEKEAAHGRILEEIVARSGEVSVLAWTGSSSSLNSCLPASPDAYTRTPFAPPILEAAKMKTRIAELATTFSPVEAGVIYGRVTGLPPVRFVNFRLHLPCIVFPVKSLSKDENVYHAKVIGLGDVDFKTSELLPGLLKEPCSLVFVNPWIDDLKSPSGSVTAQDDTESETASDEDSDLVSKSDVDAELDRVSLVKKITSGLASLDDYTRALQLIARLGQPFGALLLARQPDGSFKRVAADHEIIVPGLGPKIPKYLRAEVLEIL